MRFFTQNQVSVMALQIISPRHSFVQFGETGTYEHCVHGTYTVPLPVVEYTDVAFQFYLNGTSSELDDICGVYGIPVQIGIVSDCDDADFLTEFTGNPYNDEPEIYRLGDTQLLINWAHGLPGFDSVVANEECFHIRIKIGDDTWCSNVHNRTADSCFTSVIDYTNDENFAGFNYCSSGAVDAEAASCEPTIIEFTNQSLLTIPYTQSLKDAYGDAPSVQVFISDGTSLVNMGITATFDDYPVNTITIDLGGPGSGIVIIR
jgi:hypothetical protein